MLKPVEMVPLSDVERGWYEQLVPKDHFLRRLPEIVDFERFRSSLSSAYSHDMGRPPVDPVLMLKLEILARHYNLSDRELMKQAQVNVAFRLFLRLSVQSPLPHHTSMTYFRERVGAAVLQEAFHALLGQARELGLVRDRLRLKDATHIIANIAVPSTIRLVAETREQLLETLVCFAPQRVAQERQRAEEIRLASADLKDEERLVRRVAHLQAVLAWADEVPAQSDFAAAPRAEQERLRQALALAHKVLADREPKAEDKLLSVHDPEARRGKHGGYFHGYLLDVAMDADSELLTGVNMLPANGNEGADATYLLHQEEAAHGNDVQGLSMDGAGYRGELLRELQDPQGLNLEVFVPPADRPAPQVFGPEHFTRSADGTTLTCPAGQSTTWRQQRPNGVRFSFSGRTQCQSCPLRAHCLPHPHAKRRAVLKNAYEAEYRAAQAKAQTPAYAEVRKQHPRIERKLAELVCRHQLRHTRYRGLSRVRRQSILTALVVNLKRMAKLLQQRICQALDPPPTETMRAALAGGG
jgi:transposase